MATTTITDSQRELISSLSPDEIPIKLRCANCSKLAINAFRLPCCEQAICETCHSSLPTSCPVCEHSPLSADDCKLHKSLRTTVRVFLRSEEKKRDNLKLKEAKEQAADVKDVTTTPTPTGPPPSASEPSQAQVQGQGEAESTPTVSAAQGEPQGDKPPAANVDLVEGEEAQVATPNGNPLGTTMPDEKEQSTADNQVAVADHDGDAKELVQGSIEDVGDAEKDTVEDGAQTQAGVGGNYAYGASNGTLPNMAFAGAGAGDYNQMQMMLAMQNGMQPNAFAGFPMMGMPGMSMDPTVMQNMYMNMNGGYNQGMGMNMGAAGYGGGGENWNEQQQQSWNSFGQDSYNHANSHGMGAGGGGGDYGNYNSGPHQQTGFNQGNFGGHQQFNNYQRGNFVGGFRGRGGRGRGGYQDGYGRGRFHGQPNFGNQNFGGQNQGNYQQQQQQQPYGMPGAAQGHEQGGATDETGGENKTDDATDRGKEGTADAGSQPAGDQGPPRPMTSTPQGDAPGGPNAARGYAKVISVANPDVPINAPTGPKAMRQGLPNTSVAHLRARGLLVDEERRYPQEPGSADLESNAGDRRRSGANSPARHRDSEREYHGDRSRGHDRENGSRAEEHDGRQDRDRSRSSGSKSRGRDGSRSRKRKSSHRHSRRERSESAAGTEELRERRKHRSRKHSSRAGDEEEGKRSRSASPDDSKRSSRRSRREREPEPEKRSDRHRDEDRRRRHHREDRDRDRDRDGDKHKERDRDHDREKDRDRDRDRKERRDRDREKRHRSRRHTPEPESSRAEKEKPDKPADSLHTFFPAIERMNSKSSNIKSKGLVDRRASQSQGQGQAPVSSADAGKDPHTLEREARDRERLLKEAQRMASLSGGTKRGRAEDDDEWRRRRKGRRSEAVSGDDSEARMKRLEEEREAARWG